MPNYAVLGCPSSTKNKGIVNHNVSYHGDEATKCHCSMKCKECVPGFHKVLDLDNTGVIIYRHTTEPRDINPNTRTVKCSVEKIADVYILHNNRDTKISSTDYVLEIERKTIKCPRCRNIKEHAQKVLQKGPNISGNDVKGLCDHCKMNEAPCFKCQEVVKKFISKKPELKEKVQQLLTKIGHLLQSKIDEKNRPYSKIQIDKIGHVHDPDIEVLFKHYEPDLTAPIQTPIDENKFAHIPQLDKQEKTIILKYPFKCDAREGVMPSTSTYNRSYTFDHVPPGKETKDIFIAPPDRSDSREKVGKMETMAEFEQCLKYLAQDTIVIKLNTDFKGLKRASRSTESLLNKIKDFQEDDLNGANRIIFPRKTQSQIPTKQKSSSKLMKGPQYDLFIKAQDDLKNLQKKQKQDDQQSKASIHIKFEKTKDLKARQSLKSHVVQKPEKNNAKKDAEKTERDALRAEKSAKKAESDIQKTALKAKQGVLKAASDAQKAERDAQKATLKAKQEALKAASDAEKAERDAIKALRDAQKAERDAQKAAQTEDKNAIKQAEKAKKKVEQAALKSGKQAEKAEKNAEKAALKAEKDATNAEQDALKAKQDAQKAEKEAQIAEKEAQKAEKEAKTRKNDPRFMDSNVKITKKLSVDNDNLILNLVSIKQSEKADRKVSNVPVINLNIIKPNIETRIVTQTSSIVLDEEIKEEINDIIIGPRIYKRNYSKEQSQGADLVKYDEYTEKQDNEGSNISDNDESSSDTVDNNAKSFIKFTLSDRTFIDKGWTMLPTEKIVRKMNVYRMRPAHPEFDWFKHNKNKRLMQYDSGEKLAEFDDNGRGRWFYRNGRMALDYYDAEELHAGQRFVVYSKGEPDERGRFRPYTLLATFDYLGNGIVFDHAGKIRLKYNQTEGVVLDRSIGPISHWKWHSLNDPPVLQQVMIDTQMTHKDDNILKMGGSANEIPRQDNEDMLAIEFDNFVKEKSKKLSQVFKPYQIKMKALKINEHFSLKVLDQATVYLIYRDGTTNLKLNIGMVLDHREIVNTDTAEVGVVSTSLEILPARTNSLAGMRKKVCYAEHYDKMRTERERMLRSPCAPCESVDKLVAGTSRPLRTPLRTMTSNSTVINAADVCKYRRKPTASNVYYDTRLC